MGIGGIFGYYFGYVVRGFNGGSSGFGGFVGYVGGGLVNSGRSDGVGGSFKGFYGITGSYVGGSGGYGLVGTRNFGNVLFGSVISGSGGRGYIVRGGGSSSLRSYISGSSGRFYNSFYSLSVFYYFFYRLFNSGYNSFNNRGLFNSGNNRGLFNSGHDRGLFNSGNNSRGYRFDRGLGFFGGFVYVVNSGNVFGFADLRFSYRFVSFGNFIVFISSVGFISSVSFYSFSGHGQNLLDSLVNIVSFVGSNSLYLLLLRYLLFGGGFGGYGLGFFNLLGLFDNFFNDFLLNGDLLLNFFLLYFFGGGLYLDFI